MLLAIDIGNSKTLFGIFRGKKIISRSKYPTPSINQQSFSARIRKIFKGKKIDGIVISSVVPDITPKLTRCIRQISGLKPLCVSPDLKLGIRLGYKNPKHLGQDRIANAVAAYKIYRGPLIIVDYGTAITICCITKNGFYKGGIILPGIDMITSSLAQHASLLPHVKKIKKPERLIGTDTEESIISGVVYGINEMVDGIIRKIKRKAGYKPKVLSTGGAAKFFFPISKEIDMIDSDLTLKGLYYIYEMNHEMD